MTTFTTTCTRHSNGARRTHSIERPTLSSRVSPAVPTLAMLLLITGVIRTATADDCRADIAQVRSARSVFQSQDAVIRKAAARLLPTALDRSREIGRLGYLKHVTATEIEHREAELKQARHRPGQDAFQSALMLEQTLTELRSYQQTLETESTRLREQHLRAFVADSQQPQVWQPDRSIQSLLTVLKANLPTPTPDQTPETHEVARPATPPASSRELRRCPPPQALQFCPRGN